MEIVSVADLSDGLERHACEAADQPLGISIDGRLSFVLIPVDDYRRFRRRERVAVRIEDLDHDTLEALRTVEPGRGSLEAEAKLKLD